jgi:hypothetical protein
MGLVAPVERSILENSISILLTIEGFMVLLITFGILADQIISINPVRFPIVELGCIFLVMIKTLRWFEFFSASMIFVDL